RPQGSRHASRRAGPRRAPALPMLGDTRHPGGGESCHWTPRCTGPTSTSTARDEAAAMARAKTLKLATFNVNGIGTRLPHLLAWLEREQPDIVALQELKAVDGAF